MEGVSTVPAGAGRVDRCLGKLYSQVVAPVHPTDAVEIGTLCGPIEKSDAVACHPVLRVLG